MPSTAETNDRDDPRLPPKLDWVHLPANMTTVSLWDSLHDGKLIAVRSDLFSRTVILEFRIGYLNNFHKFPEDCRFLFEFVRVSSVRATRWSRWPGSFQVPEGTARYEESRLIDEYQAKWREESDGWSSVEERLSSGKISEFEISNADLALGRNAVALQLHTQSADQGFQVLTVAAEELRVRRTGDTQLSLEAFVRLGEEYWTAFANRSA